MYRKIQQILQADRVNMDGIYLHQALPIEKIERIDPYLLIHHWKNTLPGNLEQKNFGVGPHAYYHCLCCSFVQNGWLHISVGCRFWQSVR